MGLLRNLAHTLFGVVLLATLWVTALSFLSMRGPAIAVITDLGVDALNPFLVSKHIGLDATGYAHLQQVAAAFPDKSVSVSFIKAPITGSQIAHTPYAQGLRLIYGDVAQAYYDGGPNAVFNLPAPIASAVQTFALFPEQYDSALKATALPTWLQPFLTYTGLAPDTLTATGHARIAAFLPKFWLATLALAAVVFLLNLLGKRNPVQSLGLAIWHGSWPTVAIFAVLWLIGRLYPANVQPVAAAFGVVATTFLPVYIVAAVVGLGAYILSRFAGALFHLAGKEGKAGKRAPAPAMGGAYGDYGAFGVYGTAAPKYVPGGSAAGEEAGMGARQGPTQPRQGAPSGPGAQRSDAWSPPPRQPWEQPAQPTRSAAPGASNNPYEPYQPYEPYDANSPLNQGLGVQDEQPTWNTRRPWDAPRLGAAGQDDPARPWMDYPPTDPDDRSPYPRR